MKSFTEFLTEGVYDPGIFKAIFLVGGPGCFSGDTLIYTENGMKQIKDVEINEKVYTLDNDKKVTLNTVLTKFEYNNFNNQLIEIKLENGEKIKCTPIHKIRLKSGDWIEARNLTENDELYSL